MQRKALTCHADELRPEDIEALNVPGVLSSAKMWQAKAKSLPRSEHPSPKRSTFMKYEECAMEVQRQHGKTYGDCLINICWMKWGCNAFAQSGPEQICMQKCWAWAQSDLAVEWLEKVGKAHAATQQSSSGARRRGNSRSGRASSLATRISISAARAASVSRTASVATSRGNSVGRV